MGYDYENFNNESIRAYELGWGDNYCKNLHLDNKVSSLRHAGDPAADYREQDAINIYQKKYFAGSDWLLYNNDDSLDYDKFGSSVIVTGCSQWSLYESKNFEGNCVCVYPTYMNGICEPGFYKDPNIGFNISSVRRKYCCEKRIAPDVIKPNQH